MRGGHRVSLDIWLESVPYDGPTAWAMDRLVLGREGVTRWGEFRQALREVAMRRAQPAGARRDRELAHFERRAEELGEALTGAHGQLSEAVCDRLDREHVETKARLMVALDLFTSGRVSPGTADLMLALDPPARTALLDLMRTPDATRLEAEIVSAGLLR